MVKIISLIFWLQMAAAASVRKLEILPEIKPEILQRVERAHCAVFVGRVCIPPCRRHYGKVSRKCSNNEKRKHLMYYLFASK